MFCRTAEFSSKSQPQRSEQAYTEVADDVAYPVLVFGLGKKDEKLRNEPEDYCHLTKGEQTGHTVVVAFADDPDHSSRHTAKTEKQEKYAYCRNYHILSSDKSI